MSYDYDLLVLGGGAAGLTAAGLAASAGAKTLLVERHRLGGDCTWTGCVPSKTLLHAASLAHRARTAEAVGIRAGEPEVDFGAVMEHVRSTRRRIYEEADTPERLAEFGIETTHATARFADSHTVELETETGGRSVTARKIIVATGGHPQLPPIDGVEEVNHLTTETLFELEERPDRLAIIGAGPIGTEIAQAFQRLGSQVTVIEQANRILTKDHAELARSLRGVLENEGVAYRLGAAIERVDEVDGTISITLMHDEKLMEVQADALLVAAGRRPNVDGLGLKSAGVDYSERGISVDERCRTSQRHIFAIGDVTGRYEFSHMSEHMAKVAATNAVLKVPMKIDRHRVPWVTYTDPELAHVGRTERSLKDGGSRYETYRFPMERLDRAVCEGATTGWIRIYATKWTGAILGADVLGPRAGELIGTIALAMRSGTSMRTISDTIFPYPTYGQGVRRAADQWYARKQKPWLVKGLQRVFGYDGPVQDSDPDRIV